MEAVGDKLKLLDYEGAFVRGKGLSPLPHGYFTGAAVGAPPEVQLVYLYHLVCWLLDISVAPGHTLAALAPRAGAATFEADASAAVSAVLSALSQAPPPLTSFGGMAPHRLRGARGADVCAMLHALTDVALQARGFGWGTPQHRAAVAAAEEEGYDEEIEEDDGAAITAGAAAATARRRRGPTGGGGGGSEDESDDESSGVESADEEEGAARGGASSVEGAAADVTDSGADSRAAPRPGGGAGGAAAAVLAAARAARGCCH